MQLDNNDNKDNNNNFITMRTFKHLLTIIIAIAILTIPFACKKKTENPNPDPKPTPGEVIVADITKVMDANTRAAISSIDTTNFTFTFNGESDLLNNIKVGDILVDSASDLAHYGYLRRVTGITGTKGGKVVTTEQAGLTQAVLQGSIEFNSGKLKTTQISHMELAKGVTLVTNKNSDFTVFDMDYNMEFGSGNDKITVDGNTSLDISVFFNFDWDYCILCAPPEVEVTLFESGVELNQSASINITSQYGASLSKRIPLATYYFQPWTFFVGPVPVVFVPKIELFIGVDGTLTAEFSTGANEAFNGKLGTRYTADNGWSTIKDKSFTYNYYPPQLDVSANVEANLGPEVSLMLYGVAGPFTNVTACAKLDAMLHSGTSNWDLDYKIGVKTEVGIRIDVLFFEDEWSSDFCLFEQSLMHLENEPMETGVFFEKPVDGNWLPMGSDVTLKARVTGANPSSVDFLVDGTQIASLTQEPWEYVWNTQGVSHGDHQLIVNDVIGTDIVSSDTITISLLNAEWEIINLSNQNLNNETINTDVFFSSSDEGWISGGTAYGLGGYMLHTTDGGVSWNNLSPTGLTAPNTLMKMLFLNENEILARTFASEVITSNGWGLITYQVGNDVLYTFNGFEVSDLALDIDGNIVATGNYYNDKEYKLFYAKSVPFNYDPLYVIDIPYYYDDMPTTPKIYYKNFRGIVYNIKNQSNPLRQYIMLNGGSGWETLQLNALGITRDDDVYGAFFLDDNTGWLVGRESQGYAFVLKTTDGGHTWDKINVENAFNFGSIWMLSTQEGYATVNVTNANSPANKLYHTQDGGNTWEPLEIVNTILPMKKVFFKGPYLGYTVGQGADIFKFSVSK